MSANSWLCRILCLSLLGAGCAPRASLERSAQPPAGMPLHIAPESGLQLTGTLRGPLAGLGPTVDFRILLLGDGRLRADLRYELEAEAQHDVVLWTPEAILRFDRRRGGVQELGSAGQLEYGGADLQLSQLVFLLLGRWLPDAHAESWTLQGSSCRARVGPMELECRWSAKQGRGEQQHLRWVDGEAKRRLSSDSRAFAASPLGAIPRRLELSGHGIRGRVYVDLEVQVVAVDELADFDPLADR